MSTLHHPPSSYRQALVQLAPHRRPHSGPHPAPACDHDLPSSSASPTRRVENRFLAHPLPCWLGRPISSLLALARTTGQMLALLAAAALGPGSRAGVVLIGMSLGLIGGCGYQELDVTYGQRRGTPGGESINGTSVLAELFEQRGFSVSTWRRLSPKLDQFDLLVWCPDNFKPPDEATREYLEDWLAASSGRVLVYVGRDYDATVPYWNRFLQQVPADQRREVARRLASAQATFDTRQSEVPLSVDAHWFELERIASPPGPFALSGSWSDGVDNAKADIQISTRMRFLEVEEPDAMPAAPGERIVRPLLLANGEPLVTEIEFNNGSRLYLVLNGSFLLNYPLANAEHRKLAARLIADCGEPRGRRLAFLETGPDGPPILDKEAGDPYPTGLELFTVWPLGVMMLHLTLLGIVACFALFPIFGRPREQPISRADDYHAVTEVVLQEGEMPVSAVRAHFGKHVDALGRLLEKTQDHDFARQRLKEYQERVKRELPGPRS